MFGRQKQMPSYLPYTVFPTSYYQHGYLNSPTNRIMPQQNYPYQQTNYNYGNGMEMSANISPMYYPSNSSFPMDNSWQGGAGGYGQKHNVSQLLFENPLQPQMEKPFGGGFQPNPPLQNMNPYPQHAHHPKQPSGLQSVMNSFKSQDGNIDVNKMIDTAGQMMNAVTQVSSMVKGLGGIFKT